MQFEKDPISDINDVLLPDGALSDDEDESLINSCHSADIMCKKTTTQVLRLWIKTTKIH